MWPQTALDTLPPILLTSGCNVSGIFYSLVHSYLTLIKQLSQILMMLKSVCLFDVEMVQPAFPQF